MLPPIILILGFLSLVVFQLNNLADDPGVGWHLMTGKVISQSGNVPSIDPFLNFPTPRPWVADQWLSDLLLYFTFTLGEWPLVYAVLISIFFLTFFGVYLPWLTRLTRSPNLAAIATLLAFKMAQIHFIVRPVVCSFLLFALLLRLVWPRENNPRPMLSGLLVGLLFVFWANLHPAFFLGFLVLGLKFIDLALAARFKDAAAWCAITAFAILCTLVNPYGLGLHRSILSLANDPFFMNLHMEWLSPDIMKFEGQLFYGTLVLLSLLWLTTWQKLKISPFEFLSLGLFTYLTYDAVRILPFFGMLVGPWLVIRSAILASIFGAYIKLPGLKSLLRKTYVPILPAALLLCLLTFGDALLRGQIFTFSGPFGPHPDGFPYQATKAILDVSAPKTSINVAASPDFGGFLVWQSNGKIRPLLDDRNTLVGSKFYQSFEAAFQPEGPWREFARAHQVQFLLLTRNSPFQKFIAEAKLGATTEFFVDSHFVVYKIADLVATNVPP